MLVVTPFNTPIGCLRVAYDKHFIYQAAFINEHSLLDNQEAPLKAIIFQELTSYLNNPLHHFRLPLKPQGSPFQERVWEALLAIPAGQAITYGELAKSLQSAPRAIGQACKKNPLALFIPCHRVVAKNDLGGYMGRLNGVNYKERLLRHEAGK